MLPTLVGCVRVISPLFPTLMACAFPCAWPCIWAWSWPRANATAAIKRVAAAVAARREKLRLNCISVCLLSNVGPLGTRCNSGSEVPPDHQRSHSLNGKIHAIFDGESHESQDFRYLLHSANDESEAGWPPIAKRPFVWTPVDAASG